MKKTENVLETLEMWRWRKTERKKEKQRRAKFSNGRKNLAKEVAYRTPRHNEELCSVVGSGYDRKRTRNRRRSRTNRIRQRIERRECRLTRTTRNTKHARGNREEIVLLLNQYIRGLTTKKKSRPFPTVIFP